VTDTRPMTPIFGRVRGRRRVKIPAQGAASLAIFDASGIATCSAGPPESALRSVLRCWGKMWGAESSPAVQDLLKIPILPACHRCQDIAKYVAEFPKAAPFRRAVHALKLAWSGCCGETEQGWRRPPNG
jgi:hypothetical protein